MRNWAVIDLDAIRYNYETLRARAGGRPVLAVVKADAYGHGAPRIGRLLQRIGCERLAVATTEEALSLRNAGLRIPIQMLACVPPSDYHRAVGEDFIFTLGSVEEVDTLADTARAAGSRETVHIEIDTGMGRSGCRIDHAEELIARITGYQELALEGAMTHFPSADDPEDLDGVSFALGQLREFHTVEKLLVEAGIPSPVLHAANSAALARISESHLTLVRPGGALFGLSAGPATAAEVAIEPTLSWHATVVQVREFKPNQTVGYGRSYRVDRPTKVATIAVGYGDGYARMYGPGGSVLVAGRRAPIVGRVSMDSTCIDVSSAGEVRTGDDVLLIGRSGQEEITTSELAERAHTSPYEVTCRISARVPRKYEGGP